MSSVPSATVERDLLIEQVSLGEDTGRGNLLGIQPWLTQNSYVSESALRDSIAVYLDEAQRLGWLGPRTIAVLPEYIGTWLAAVGSGGAVRATTLTGAMRGLALRDPLRLAGGTMAALLRGRVWRGRFDPWSDLVLRLRARRMARSYSCVWSDLARRYAITIVGGSIVLPGARVVSGRVVSGAGALQNVSAVWGPDGRAHPQIVRKVHPIVAEQPFIAPGAAADLPVFDTPAGRLGVLICADSWYPDTYAALRRRGVELLAVPTYLTPGALWDAPWLGYNGSAAPADVDPGDRQRFSEREAWHRYTLPGRIGISGARYAVNAFLRGQLWDMQPGGASFGVRRGDWVESPPDAGASLVNVWL